MAKMTHIGLCSCVFRIVSGQHIKSGKLTSASFPCAMVWFLPCVGIEVGLEMAIPGINLITARVVTPMYLFIFSPVIHILKMF